MKMKQKLPKKLGWGKPEDVKFAIGDSFAMKLIQDRIIAQKIDEIISYLEDK